MIHYTRRLKYILQHRYYIKIATTLVLISILVFTLLYQKQSILKGNETEIQGIVYKKKITDDKVTLYLKSK